MSVYLLITDVDISTKDLRLRARVITARNCSDGRPSTARSVYSSRVTVRNKLPVPSCESLTSPQCKVNMQEISGSIRDKYLQHELRWRAP